MPLPGKEIERSIGTSAEEVAMREVEHYIEKVERSTEKSDDSQNQNTSKPDPQQTSSTQSYVVSQQTNVVAPKKIVLPVSETDLSVGLKQKTSTGFRWLSEWCVMMIKKYPGRVFYSPSASNYD